MLDPLLLFAISAGLMFGSALTLFILGRRVDKLIPVSRRLDQKLQRQRKDRNKSGYFSITRWGLRMAQRAGLELRPSHLTLFVTLFALVCVIAFRLKGGMGLLVTIVIFAIAIYIIALWRSATTHRILIQQLPGFIDQIIRVMGIGRSFDSALLEAISDSPAPLSKALESIVLENSLGGDLSESLEEVAELYRLHELHMVTLTLKINQRYGGSVKDMLESIITLIRQREQAERELKSLTGETRVSAWMLGIMPIAIVGYMIVVNPNYVEYLLKDPNGDTIIYTAAGLQITGGLILWRMLRSIK